MSDLNEDDIEKAMARGAERYEALHEAAKAAARKNTKVAFMCMRWIRDNRPDLFLKFREEAGFTKQYIPRPELRGKRVKLNLDNLK